MATAFYQTINQVNALRDAGYAGQALSGDRSETKDAINANPLLGQISTLTLTHASATDTYGYTVGSYAFSATTVAPCADAAAAAIQVAAAHNADPLAAAEAYATASGDDVILTSYFAGAASAFTVASPTANVSAAATQTAADATAIPFGKGVAYMAANASGSALSAAQASSIADEYCALPSALGVPSIAVVYSGTYTATTPVAAHFTLDDKTYIAVAAGANEDAAMDALAAEINLQSGVTLAANVTGTNTLTLTASKGQKLDLSISGTSDFALTEANLGDALENTLMGVSAYTWDTDNSTLGSATTEYLPGEGVKIISRGSVLVALTGSPARGDTVYIDASGDFFSAAAAGRIALPKTKAQWRGPASGGVAILDLL
jgi:hypothetical protein